MRWIIITIILLAPLGCKDRDKDPIPWLPAPAFSLTVGIQGNVTDNLDSEPELLVDGSPIPMTGGAFSVELDTQTDQEYLFEAIDDAGNSVERNCRIE